MILVGHLRKFHKSGVSDYQEDDLTQTKASDYRLFAYQIKEIAYHLKELQITVLLENYFASIEEYFNKIFDAFLKKDEVLAHKLWFENKELEKGGRKLMEKVGNEAKYNLKLLLLIVKTCRSMTALVHS